MSTEDLQLLARIDRDNHVSWIVSRVVWVAVGLVVVCLTLGGCAHPTPDLQPAPAKVYAELTVFPPLSIAYRPITLTARLIDPSGVVSCPRITWTLPDGTHSSHVSDCSPDDRASGKVDVKRGMLPPGDFHFEVEFDSQGQRWRAQRTVSIPGAE